MFFLTGGDNHASCTVKAINAATGRGCYTNSVVWTTSPSGGRGQGCVASPPATAAPPTQQSISFEVVPPSPPAPAATAAQPAAACSSPLPSPAPAPADTAGPSAAARTSPLPPPNASPSPGFATPPHASSSTDSSPLPAWSPSTVEPSSTPGSSPLRPSTATPRRRQHSQMQPPHAPAGYKPLTPHASRNLGREGDRRIDGRIR